MDIVALNWRNHLYLLKTLPRVDECSGDISATTLRPSSKTLCQLWHNAASRLCHSFSSFPPGCEMMIRWIPVRRNL